MKTSTSPPRPLPTLAPPPTPMSPPPPESPPSPLAHLLGAAAWTALALLGLPLASFALLAAGHVALGALVLVGAGVLTARGLPTARRLARARPALRRVVGGAAAVFRLTWAGQALALGALAVGALGLVIQKIPAAEGAGLLLTYLDGATALLMIAVAAGVLFPGAWFLLGRTRGRWLSTPLLLVSIALVHPGATTLFRGLEGAAIQTAPLAWAALAIGALALLSAAGVGLALALFPRPFTAMDLHPDGRLLVATRRGTSWLVELPSGRRLARLSGGARLARFARDGATFAVDEHEAIAIRRAQDGASLRHLTGGPASVEAVAIDAGAARVAAVGEGRFLVLWDARDDAPARIELPFAYLRSVAFAPEGPDVLVASHAGGVARVILSDAEPRVVVLHKPAADGGTVHGTLSPTGDGVAWASGRPPIWSRITSRRLRRDRVADAPRATELAESVRRLRFDPTGERLLVLAEDGRVTVFTPSGDAPTLTLDAPGRGLGPLASVAADAGARTVALGGRWGLWAWDPASDALRELSDPRGTGAAPAVAEGTTTSS